MKKTCEVPVVEKLEFDYKEIVVASNLNRQGSQTEQWCHKPTRGNGVACKFE